MTRLFHDIFHNITRQSYSDKTLKNKIKSSQIDDNDIDDLEAQ